VNGKKSCFFEDSHGTLKHICAESQRFWMLQSAVHITVRLWRVEKHTSCKALMQVNTHISDLFYNIRIILQYYSVYPN